MSINWAQSYSLLGVLPTFWSTKFPPFLSSTKNASSDELQQIWTSYTSYRMTSCPGPYLQLFLQRWCCVDFLRALPKVDTHFFWRSHNQCMTSLHPFTLYTDAFWPYEHTFRVAFDKKYFGGCCIGCEWKPPPLPRGPYVGTFCHAIKSSKMQSLVWFMTSSISISTISTGV